MFSISPCLKALSVSHGLISHQAEGDRVRIFTIQIGKVRDVSRAKSVGLDWEKNDKNDEDLEREVQVRGRWHSGDIDGMVHQSRLI